MKPPLVGRIGVKPFYAMTGTVWWYENRDMVDVFIVLDGCVTDDESGIECRRIFVFHSDDNSDEEGFQDLAEGSPYNDNSFRFA